MSAPVLLAATPRSDSDPLLRKSLRLWDWTQVIMWGTAVVCACIATQSIAEMWIKDAVMSIAVAAVGVYAALRARCTSDRLRRVWRDGRLIEVTVIDWYISAGRWRAAIVECEGRRGDVRFTRAPEVGMKLPALEDGDQIAVLERNKILRIGRISPPHS